MIPAEGHAVAEEGEDAGPAPAAGAGDLHPVPWLIYSLHARCRLPHDSLVLIGREADTQRMHACMINADSKSWLRSVLQYDFGSGFPHRRLKH